MADGKRTIPPDLRGLMKLACGAFCDLAAELIANPVPLRVAELGAHSESRRAMDALDAMMRIAPAVGGETDLEVILGPVAKRGRAVVSARTPAIEREHDWSGTSG